MRKFSFNLHERINLRVLEPHTVTILATNNCTAACRHCGTNSGPERRDSLTWEKLEHILLQLFDTCELSVIVFSGGEPTLLGETLLKGLRLCRERGVPTRLVTNAYWATSEAAARKKLTELKEAGLYEINISTDDFHLPFISLQNVRYAYEAALDMKFGAVVICNAYGPQSWLTPERLYEEFGRGGEMQHRYDADGVSISHRQQVGETLILLSNSMLLQLGERANETIDDAELPDLEHTDFADLGKLGGCPWAIRSPAISAKGHLVSCCGFEVEDNDILDYGDLGENSLADLLDRADNDLITNMIALIGPPRIRELLETVAKDELRFERPSYRSYCEVCEDLVTIPENRQALYKYSGHFVRDILAVREMYQEAHTVDGRVRIPHDHAIVIDADEIRAPGSAPSNATHCTPDT